MKVYQGARGIQNEPWRIEKLWDGQDCAIFAGGPSLTQQQVDAVMSSGIRTIAINNSIKLAPNCDLHYFCDHRWWEWHKSDPEVRDFIGIRATLDNFFLRNEIADLRCVMNIGQRGISLTPGEIKHGSNSGYQSINIAIQLGVRAIYLFGYDMKPASDGRMHWHDEHPVPTPKQVLKELMLPMYAGIRQTCLDLGVDIINCTPDSALLEFPYRSWDGCVSAGAGRASLSV